MLLRIARDQTLIETVDDAVWSAMQRGGAATFSFQVEPLTELLNDYPENGDALSRLQAAVIEELR